MVLQIFSPTCEWVDWAAPGPQPGRVGRGTAARQVEQTPGGDWWPACFGATPWREHPSAASAAAAAAAVAAGGRGSRGSRCESCRCLATTEAFSVHRCAPNEWSDWELVSCRGGWCRKVAGRWEIASKPYFVKVRASTKTYNHMLRLFIDGPFLFSAVLADSVVPEHCEALQYLVSLAGHSPMT